MKKITEYKQWENCLIECTSDKTIERFNELWSNYPDFADQMMADFKSNALRFYCSTTEERKTAAWEQIKKQLQTKEKGADVT